MKLSKLFEGSIKPWKFDTMSLMMDQKGKIQYLHPELRGPAQCPFWKTLKTKIAANLKEGVDDVKVPKSFAIEVGKEYKVPLDPTYTTPVCIGTKICAHFRGVAKGAINCDFKLGVKAGPEKKVDVASTTEPVPAVNQVEAPVKENVQMNEDEDELIGRRVTVPGGQKGTISDRQENGHYVVNLDKPGVTGQGVVVYYIKDLKLDEEVGAERGSVPAVSEAKKFKCPNCGNIMSPYPKDDKCPKCKVDLSMHGGDEIKESTGKYTFYIVNGKLTIHQPDPKDKSISVKEIKANSSKEAKEIAKAKGWIKESTQRDSVPAASEVKTAEEARQIARVWQSWQAKQQLSYSELSKWLGYFELLADKFDLRAEFKENGIISERIKETSATPAVGLTDGRPGNYPEDTMVESRYSRYASTDEQEQLIIDLEKTLTKLGKSIVGATTIGKSPQTVILDLTHQGSEIYVNASDPERDREAQLKINNIVVDPTDIEAVKSAIEGNI